MKETLEVKAPRGRLIVKPLKVKPVERNIIIPNEVNNQNTSLVYDYSPYQAIIEVVGSSTDNDYTKDLSVGDVVILGRTPSKEKELLWVKQLYYVIRPTEILGSISKGVKSKLQHIYKT